jgi:DNA-binding GntR family transcriptional regulator
MQLYEVSDGTIKRAIAKLRDEGLVESVPGRGVYVK